MKFRLWDAGRGGGERGNAEMACGGKVLFPLRKGSVRE